jgi:hypothetical protein
MAQSLRRVDPASPAAQVPREASRVAGHDRVLEVDVAGGVMRHHETMTDTAGHLIYDQAVPMEYVVGSGRRAEAFLHLRGNALFMSPLNWYSEPQKWDLAPGYVADDPRRFDRRVTDECLSCHAGRVASAGRSTNRYLEPAFHELSIGCERCHGPGAAHIAWHESGSTAGVDDDPIINPARLDAERRESVCNQCHLQADVRLTRVGRSDFDFRPGMRLDDVWTVLDAGAGESAAHRTTAVNHVQQMRGSLCYSGSAGRLGCISCHDPHSVPEPGERDAFYRTRCLNCHTLESCTETESKRRIQGDACIVCHMPSRPPSNIAHVVQTDHRIMRLPDEPGDDGPDADGLSFVDAAGTDLSAWERDRALALGAWIYLTNEQKQPLPELARHLDSILQFAPADGAVLTVLGSMALDRDLLRQAADYYERALSDPAGEEAALSGLLKICYLSQDFDRALGHADRLIALDPGNWRAHSLRADVLMALGRDAEGIASAEQALELNPSLTAVREWLVRAYRDSGQTERQHQQEEVLSRMPGGAVRD